MVDKTNVISFVEFKNRIEDIYEISNGDVSFHISHNVINNTLNINFSVGDKKYGIPIDHVKSMGMLISLEEALCKNTSTNKK